LKFKKEIIWIPAWHVFCFLNVQILIQTSFIIELELLKGGLPDMNLYLIAKNQEKIWSYSIDGEAVSIGRSNENDIQVQDRYVSRRQLMVWKKENRFFLENLGNKNGTTVNGFRIPPCATVQVKRGDAIEIGMSVLYIGKMSSQDMYAFLESLDSYKKGSGDTTTVVSEDAIYDSV
jgi:pSer/pThr/pTyr-binding forkhead associated (FHA) protein